MILGILIASLIGASFGFVILRGAPYVPTHRRQLKKAFDELHPLSSRDVVVDLGSGDGIVLQEVARRGAKGIGYELNPLLVWISRWRLRKQQGIEFFIQDYSLLKSLPAGVTIVYAFTAGHSIESIGKLMERWSKDRELYFISYGFELQHHKPVKQIGPMSLYHFSGQA